MITYSAVLIDDEIHCTESLHLLLEKNIPDIRVAAKFNDTLHAIDYLRTTPVDLVFLDIEMPEMSGFDMLNAWSQLPFDVIFVTAYDQHAVKAFTYGAVSYLLKPVDDDDLKQTISRWQEKNHKSLAQNQLHIMRQILTNTVGLKTKVALPTSDGLEFLEIQNIIRCESEGNYTWLYCSDKSKHLICRTLKDVEKVLGENGFLRVHHSHLINPQFIRKFIRHDGGYIIMEDGQQVSVSRARKDRLFEFFNNVERL